MTLPGNALPHCGSVFQDVSYKARCTGCSIRLHRAVAYGLVEPIKRTVSQALRRHFLVVQRTIRSVVA